MNPIYSPTVNPTSLRYGTEKINGLSIAYREAGDPANPKLVLFHGWPSSSHQYRDLIPPLADRFHVICPDYPGFGDSDAPAPTEFSYTFDNIAAVIEKFLDVKGFHKFGVYMQDYGGPVAFRILTKSPEKLEWIAIQNTNAYEIGFMEAWGGLRNAYWLDRNEKNEAGVAALLELDVVKAVYLTGSPKPELISPDNWNFHYKITLSRPHGRQIQLDLFYDYRMNVGLYPKWQQFCSGPETEDNHFLGTGRYLFQAGRWRGLPGRSSDGRTSSPGCWAFCRRGLSTVYCRPYAPLLRDECPEVGKRPPETVVGENGG